MSYGQAQDSRDLWAAATKLDEAVTVAKKALKRIDAAATLDEAKVIALRARAEMEEKLK